MVDYQCPTTKTYFLNSDKVAIVTVDPFHTKQFEPQGYYSVIGVTGSYSFMVQNEKAHGILTHSATL
jgi:hypothetical protein